MDFHRIASHGASEPVQRIATKRLFLNRDLSNETSAHIHNCRRFVYGPKLIVCRVGAAHLKKLDTSIRFKRAVVYTFVNICLQCLLTETNDLSTAVYKR